jgi:hypothetical protein
MIRHQATCADNRDDIVEGANVTKRISGDGEQVSVSPPG